MNNMYDEAFSKCQILKKALTIQDVFFRLNRLLEKLMPVLTPLGVILGLVLGQHIAHLKPWVIWLFAFITLSGALGLEISDFKKILINPLPVILIFVCAHVITPLAAFVLGNLVFPGQNDIVTGYILLAAIPIAVASYIWTSIYYGNGALTLTMIFLDTLLAPLVTPFIVRTLTSSDIVLDTTGMVVSLFAMVVIPSIIGVLANHFSRNRLRESVAGYCKPVSKIALLVVIAINTSQIADRIYPDFSLVRMALANVVLTVSGFLLAYGISRLIRVEKETQVSMTFASGMRNISAAMVLAINFFPAGTAIPVITGVVLQQTISALIGYFLFARHRQSRAAAGL